MIASARYRNTLGNYGLLSLLNPSSLHADFVICNNLRSPTVESAEASEPLFRSSWKINKLWGWLLAEMGGLVSPGKKQGTAKWKHPLFGEIEIVPLTQSWMSCRAHHHWQRSIRISLILMKGRPLNHQLADHHLPSFLVLVSNARNLHNFRILLGE